MLSRAFVYQEMASTASILQELESVHKGAKRAGLCGTVEVRSRMVCELRPRHSGRHCFTLCDRSTGELMGRYHWDDYVIAFSNPFEEERSW